VLLRAKHGAMAWNGRLAAASDRQQTNVKPNFIRIATAVAAEFQKQLRLHKTRGKIVIEQNTQQALWKSGKLPKRFLPNFNQLTYISHISPENANQKTPNTGIWIRSPYN